MSPRTVFRVGTRGSLLALAQTRQVLESIAGRWPGVQFETVIIKTKGDVILDSPLSKIGDKGLFTKEIEQSILSGEVDLGVHSMKDMPGAIPTGLVFGAVPRRAEPRDALVSRTGFGVDAIPRGACIGTSSLRRRSQLLHARPDLRLENLRGNLDTRLRKLREGQYDAIVVAGAGMIRLEKAAEITDFFPTTMMVPAVGQGALALEVRGDDAELREILGRIHDPETALAVEAERSFLRAMEGGCQVPLAAYAVIEKGQLMIWGVIASLDGACLFRDSLSGPATPASAKSMGADLAQHLREAGGEAVLKSIREGAVE